MKLCFKYYIDIFKSPKYLAIKQNLIDFCFSSKYIYSIHPESLTNIISAEIEFDENKLDVTYDFTSVVIKYSKTMEKEIYLFMKELFKVLIKNSKDEANTLRNKILGVADDSILTDILKYKKKILESRG
ncbi:hypothetical protein [Aliarcobacter cryaerophilus]|uniref:hypothetical protein n=1 Tax=Aliarcobacter cryaerophilus TaxID=28198 RepID=UPI00082BA81E|nr:hypothetical protein [Aliarcobacter cryaerophilus]